MTYTNESLDASLIVDWQSLEGCHGIDIEVQTEIGPDFKLSMGAPFSAEDLVEHFWSICEQFGMEETIQATAVPAELNETVDTLQAEVASLKDEIDILESEKEELEGKIEDIESTLDDIRSQI